MRVLKNHFIFRIILPLSLLLAGMVACTDDYTAMTRTDGKEEGKLNVKFTLLTRHRQNPEGGSRAEVGAEDERTGSDVENYINIDDIHFLIFGKERQFIQYLDNVSISPVGDTGYAVYEVYGNLHDDYFAGEISGSVTFYILAYANLKEWGVEESDITAPTPDVTLIEDFLASNSGILLSTAPDAAGLLHINDGTGGTPPWIPMAGVCRFTVARDMLHAASSPGEAADGAYDLTAATGNSLDMLRALGKIEVVDKINVAATYDEDIYGHYPWTPSKDDRDNKNSWLRISEVTLNGMFSRGSVFPGISLWMPDYETIQVNAPSIPTDAQYLQPQPLTADGTIGNSGSDPGSSIIFAPDRHATLLREDKCPVFSAYVFEYGKYLVDDPSRQPYMTVTTRGDNDNYRVTLPLRLAKYEDGEATAADNLDALLRNHIYTYEITGISQDVKVDWTVCDMDKLSTSITFK